MLIGGYFRVRQRTNILKTALRNELRAHAVTLQIALQDVYAAGQQAQAQRLIDHLSESSKVYSVIVFDERGEVMMFSNPAATDQLRPPAQLQQVLQFGETHELTQRDDLFSILMPIQLDKRRRGAFQISQPLSLIQADVARAQWEIGQLTLALFSATILVVVLVIRVSVLRPINDLLTGVMAFSEGDLNYRVVVPNGGGEIARLASEFNQMAVRLFEQRTQVINAAAEQLALERRLKQSERLATVGRLAAGIAHEMGAPLNVIKGRVDMLRKRRKRTTPEKQDQWLQIIDEQTNAIAHIVRQLLTLARPFHLQREVVSVPQLMRGALNLIQPEATTHKIRLTLTTHDHLQVMGDRKLLHQVLMNLCLNALQAMPNGGSLRLDALPTEQHKDNDTFIALRVTDTGPGIAPEHLPLIFDPFFTTKEIGQGTGLGLAVSHRIVEEHKGWIEAENRSEGGASFTVWLPKAVPADANDAPLHKPQE